MVNGFTELCGGKKAGNAGKPRRSHFCEPPASGARVVAAKARRMRAADAYRLRQGWRDFLHQGRQRQG